MELDFWLKRWVENKIGFNQIEVNPHLKNFFQKNSLPPNSTIFVPFCGKSIDMLWLSENGFKVVGVEISEEACLAFFQENKLKFTTEKSAEFQLFKTENITIYQGDFFNLTSANLLAPRLVYDRASLIALPSDMRKNYVAHMLRIIPTNVEILLLTIEYDQTERAGPPFSVPETEVHSHYDNQFTIEKLVDSEYKKEADRLEIKSLREKVYYLHKR